MKAFAGWRRFLILSPLVFLLPHLFSVLELHRSSNPAISHPKNSKKFDHLVLGPAAGQDLPNRLQCEGVKALDKTNFSTSSRALNVGDRVAFVTVFTIYNTLLDGVTNGRSSNLVTVGNASYNKSERSMAILNVFINFIQDTIPQSNVIILTDPDSDLSLH